MSHGLIKEYSIIRRVQTSHEECFCIVKGLDNDMLKILLVNNILKELNGHGLIPYIRILLSGDAACKIYLKGNSVAWDLPPTGSEANTTIYLKYIYWI